MALSGHAEAAGASPLSGVKRTLCRPDQMSANDPKRKSREGFRQRPASRLLTIGGAMLTLLRLPCQVNALEPGIR